MPTGQGERPPVRTFRDLLVWQKAITVARQVYELTKRFPRDERFGLTNQVRRAAVSVSSNIAEGHARQGREFGNFLSIARGSLAEVESQLILATVLGYTTEEGIAPTLGTATEIHLMIASLSAKLPR